MVKARVMPAVRVREQTRLPVRNQDLWIEHGNQDRVLHAALGSRAGATQNSAWPEIKMESHKRNCKAKDK